MCATQFRVRHKLIFTELNKISAEIYLRYLMVCCSLIENLTSLVTVRTNFSFKKKSHDMIKLSDNHNSKGMLVWHYIYITEYPRNDSCIFSRQIFERPNLIICCNLTENLTSLVTVRTKKGFVANPRKSMGIAKHKLSRVGFNIRVP